MGGFRSFLVTFVLVALSASALHCRSDVGEAADRQRSVPILGSAADFRLTDQYGRTVERQDFRGKIWIATVTFTRSRTSTPAKISFMEDLYSQISRDSLWHSVQLVNLTAEPEHDTPDVLRTYAEEAGADSTTWFFLTGDRAELANLIESIGLPLLDGARSSSGPITLSPKIVLVDRGYHVRGVYDIYEAAESQTLMADLGLIFAEAPYLDDGTGRTHLVAPLENLDLSWIEKRRRDQLQASTSRDVFNDFSFTNSRNESGITFRNKIVDNAGKYWMPNHYDHGNGVTTADVDGDGLPDLYFTTQVGSNELWRNRGNGRFENITESAGVGLAKRISVSASFADIDNDGDPDLYVTTVKGGNALFENDGTGTFTDISTSSRTDYRGHSSGAVFFDYDQDGLVDLLVVNVGIYTKDTVLPVTNGTTDEQRAGRYEFYEGLEDAFTAHIDPQRSEHSILYKNLGSGIFSDVTADVGLLDDSWSGDATPIDANNDGWQDLYLLNMQGDDQYYENVRGERFVKKSRDHFPQTPWGSMGAKSFDYNNDGRMDLFLTDMHSDMSKGVEPHHEKAKADMQWPDTLLAGGANNIFGNAFFQNMADGRYREISSQIGAENYWPWGLSVGDLNADGFQDAFITSSMNFPFRYGVNSVLLNDGGRRFIDSEFVLGVEPRPENQVLTPWIELECGGADQQHEYCEGQIGDVVVWGAAGSRSAVVIDIDGDGDLDVVTNDFNSEPLVLTSNLSERKRDLNFLKVRLIGTQSNRDGLGARVTLSAGGRSFTQILDGATGYLSHGIHPLYFGLGEASAVDRIEISWPSGTRQVLEGPIEANRSLEIRESR